MKEDIQPKPALETQKARLRKVEVTIRWLENTTSCHPSEQPCTSGVISPRRGVARDILHRPSKPLTSDSREKANEEK